MSKWSKRSSVALDEETYAISRKVGNFSEFVRECLRRWNAYETGTHIQPQRPDGRKCYPRSKKGCCVLCWPHGPPFHNDWMFYQEQFRMHQTSATEFIEARAREANISEAFPIPKETTFKKSRKAPPKVGFFSSIREKIRNRSD